MAFVQHSLTEQPMPHEYAEATFRDLQALAELQVLFGDPRRRVEVASVAVEGDLVPMPACRRYETSRVSA